MSPPPQPFSTVEELRANEGLDGANASVDMVTEKTEGLFAKFKNIFSCGASPLAAALGMCATGECTAGNDRPPVCYTLADGCVAAFGAPMRNGRRQ